MKKEIHIIDQKEHGLLLEILWWKEFMKEECQANGLLKSENFQD